MIYLISFHFENHLPWYGWVTLVAIIAAGVWLARELIRANKSNNYYD